jgi:hypothetical protein
MFEVENPSYRYERKFLIDQLDHHQVRGIVRRHPAMFIQPYPPRFINNFYFDTADMGNYFDNVNGAADRRKVRIRWYGELVGHIQNPILEFKIKRGLVGTKLHFLLPAFDVDVGFGDETIRRLALQADISLDIKRCLLDQKVVLLNRYYRYYYASRDGKYRLTVDTDLSYCRVARYNNLFAHSQYDHEHCIVELKYDVDDDRSAMRISSFFPFRITKNSKYVQGIERVYF